MNPDLKEQIQKLKEQGFSETEIKETVHMVTTLMKPFADAAWGQHSVQLAINTKDKNSLCLPASYAKLEETVKGEN